MTKQNLKVCSICKIPKLLSEFNKNKVKKDGLQTHCRDCNKKSSAAYYGSNKEHHKKVTAERKWKNVAAVRQFVFDLLRREGCIDCGEKDPIVLEFDHVTGEKKDNISHMIGHGCSLIIVLEEIEKCVIRCANCHRRKTAKDQNWYCNINTGL